MTQVKRFIQVEQQPFNGPYSPFYRNRNHSANQSTPELRSQYEVTTEFYNNTPFDFCVKDRLNMPMVFTQRDTAAKDNNTKGHPYGLIIVKNYRCDPRVFDTMKQVAQCKAHEQGDLAMYYRHIVSTGMDPGHFNQYARDISFSVTYVINPDYFHADGENMYVPDLDLIVACFKTIYRHVSVLVENTADHPKYGQVLMQAQDSNHGYNRNIHLVDRSNTISCLFIREGENIIKIDAEKTGDFADNHVDGIYIFTTHNGRKTKKILPIGELLTEEGQQKLATLGIFSDMQKARTVAEHQYKAEMLKKETAIIKAENEARQAKNEMDLLNRKIEQLQEDALMQAQRKKDEQDKHEKEMEKIRVEHENALSAMQATQAKLKAEKELNEQKAANAKSEYEQRSKLSSTQYTHDMNTISRKETSDTRKAKSDTWKYVVGIAASVVAVGVSVWKWFSGR